MFDHPNSYLWSATEGVAGVVTTRDLKTYKYKFSNKSVKTILLKMTFKEKELNGNSLPMKIQRCVNLKIFSLS